MNDVIRHLQYLIRRHDAVIINGLGALRAVNLPAFTDGCGRVVIPPTRSIYFEADDTISTDGMLEKSIMRRNSVDEESAQAEVSKWKRDFSAMLKDRGMFIAGRLGNFYLKNNSIEFKPNRNTSAYNPFDIFESKPMETAQSTESRYGVWSLRRKTMMVLGAVATFASALFA